MHASSLFSPFLVSRLGRSYLKADAIDCPYWGVDPRFATNRLGNRPFPCWARLNIRCPRRICDVVSVMNRSFHQSLLCRPRAPAGIELHCMSLSHRESECCSLVYAVFLPTGLCRLMVRCHPRPDEQTACRLVDMIGSVEHYRCSIDLFLKPKKGLLLVDTQRG